MREIGWIGVSVPAIVVHHRDVVVAVEAVVLRAISSETVMQSTGSPAATRFYNLHNTLGRTVAAIPSVLSMSFAM